jgi:hypothetical protein
MRKIWFAKMEFSMRTTRSLFLCTILSVALTACARSEAPKAGTLSQKLRMVGDDARYYGTVEFDPIRGGKIYDAQGQWIGDIVPHTAQ